MKFLSVVALVVATATNAHAAVMEWTYTGQVTSIGDQIGYFDHDYKVGSNFVASVIFDTNAGKTWPFFEENGTSMLNDGNDNYLKSLTFHFSDHTVDVTPLLAGMTSRTQVFNYFAEVSGRKTIVNLPGAKPLNFGFNLYGYTPFLDSYAFTDEFTRVLREGSGGYLTSWFGSLDYFWQSDRAMLGFDLLTMTSRVVSADEPNAPAPVPVPAAAPLLLLALGSLVLAKARRRAQ